MGLVDLRVSGIMSQMSVGIVDVEIALPQKIVSNEELAEGLGRWTAEEIYQKVGIRERHVSGPDEFVSDLAIAAGDRLLERWPEDVRRNIDLLIVSTQTPDYMLPTTACLVQHRLGLRLDLSAFDISLGCSGFVYALSVARSMILSGDASVAMVCCADTYCKWIGCGDVATRPIFGDGAAAVLLARLSPGRKGIGTFVFGTDGRGWDKLIIRGSGSHAALNSPPAAEADRHLSMAGPEIFRFATVTVRRAIEELYSRSGLRKEDIDWFVFHQASDFILSHLRDTCGIEEAKMPIVLERTGNTVSASIPLVLRRLLDDSKLRCGQRLVLVGFGVGYSWACCDLTWQSPAAFPGF